MKKKKIKKLSKKSGAKKAPRVKEENKKQKSKVKKTKNKISYLSSDDDAERISGVINSEGGSSNPNYLKTKPGRTGVYLTHKIAWYFYHYFSGKKYLCEGGEDGRGFAPDECKACKRSLNYYLKKKTTSSKEKKAFYNKLGNELRGRGEGLTKLVAGELVKERVKGKKITVVDFDKKAEEKFYRITEYTFLQMTKGRLAAPNKDKIVSIMESHSNVMKSTKDLYNRALVLDKEEGQYGKTIAIPSKRKTDPPKFVNKGELDFEEELPVDDSEEMYKAMAEHEKNVKDDGEDENEEEYEEKEIDEKDDDDDDSEFDEDDDDSEDEEDDEDDDDEEDEDDDDDDEDDEDEDDNKGKKKKKVKKDEDDF